MNWIPVKLAAAMMGYRDLAYFRRIFCDEDAPILVIRVRRGPKGQRRICVLESSVLDQIQSEIRRVS